VATTNAILDGGVPRYHRTYDLCNIRVFGILAGAFGFSTGAGVGKTAICEEANRIDE
jgi:hypothetical protein